MLGLKYEAPALRHYGTLAGLTGSFKCTPGGDFWASTNASYNLAGVITDSAVPPNTYSAASCQPSPPPP